MITPDQIDLLASTALTAGKLAGVKEERARICNWLRDVYVSSDGSLFSTRALAEAIELGAADYEHKIK